MLKSTATAVTLAAALLAIAIPVLLAIYLADRQARQTEMRVVTNYAKDVLHRSEATADQVFAAQAALIAGHSADPCSDSNIAIMRRFDLASSYLQAIGYVKDGVLLCSSLGRDVKSVVLGPVDWATPSKVQVRIKVVFPFDPATSYLVTESPEGFAAIINKDLPLDVATNETDASLSAFSTGNGRIMASHGFVDPPWVGPNSDTLPRTQAIATFVDHNYVVAVARSSRYYIGAIAALPVSYMSAQVRATSMILLPVGVIAGLVLAFATVYLGRLQLAMPAVIRTALKRREFFLMYQPIVDLRTRQWVGAEALLRWRRPGGEMVRPDLFIQAAEDAGLIQRITRHVVTLVARDVEDLFTRRPDFHIAINISSDDLHAESTVALLQQLARDTHATAGNLIVEVTERGLVRRDPAHKIVRALRASGIRIAIDDFGTGYSSLAFLESFELDFLKIDKSFVDTMNLDTPTSQVALHIIEMAKSLNLRMVAEGVESEAQAQFLSERGVQFAQGWLFAKAIPLHELIVQMPQPGR
ncbi:MAG TPA: EAL domain-containing protein [Steroidobacteraceae bacterium]|nr:EAL domain-containing protein [Steroidobacteraceae bacterium]